MGEIVALSGREIAGQVVVDSFESSFLEAGRLMQAFIRRKEELDEDCADFLISEQEILRSVADYCGLLIRRTELVREQLESALRLAKENLK